MNTETEIVDQLNSSKYPEQMKKHRLKTAYVAPVFVCET